MAAGEGPHSQHLPLSKKTAGASHRITPGPCCGGRGAGPAGVGGSAAIPRPFLTQSLGSEKPQIELAKWLSCIDFYARGYFEGN